jgi:hypothetical protein
MKNIHILQTDRPSGLFRDINGKLGFNTKWTEIPLGRKNQNINITSDEDVEVNDVVIDLETNDVFISKGKMLCNDFIKKIILTTDLYLIKNGVQSIDSEFLEWFVKNPSCERVEIEKTFVTNSGLGYQEYAILDSDFKVLEVVANRPQSSYKIGEVTELDGYEYITEYKIIIPQEEQKQLTDLEIAIKLEDIEREEWQQKAPEEAAQKQWGNVHRAGVLGFIEGANWQAQRMYSEEDLRNAYRWGTTVNHGTKEHFNEWFEQFKKK